MATREPRRGRNEWLLYELRRPEAYPGGVSAVETRQTLVSLLFFVGERVYKLKQAVDLGFIDATTLEKRRALCLAEARLNAALAPGVHLGIVPVTRGLDGHLALGGRGEVVEWAVEMVRLPEERMLARLLERGVIDNAQMNALAERLAGFHREAATGPGVDEYGTPEGIAVSVEENFEQLAPFVAPETRAGAEPPALLTRLQHDFLRRRARAFLSAERQLLLARVAGGRIREGHGDLHAENVCCLPEGLVIYDRIEFNRRFRCLDVASDLAFLAMDLDLRGYPGFSGYLAHRYGELAADPELARLLPFYKGYRAIVRAKVAALSAIATSDAARREELRREGMGYLQLALGYEFPPTLVLLSGLPATGKTFLSGHLVRPLRAAVFRSDERRKRLADLSAESSARSAWGEGLYTGAERSRTYRSLLDDAVGVLRSGRSAVVDATFSRVEFRGPFVDAAARLGLPFCLVLVSAPEDVVRARLAARTEGPSDADFDVYARERQAFEPPEELPSGRVVAVDSTRGAPEDHCAGLFERLIAQRE
jgi:hypothetical protein